MVEEIAENCKKSWDLLVSEILSDEKERKLVNGKGPGFETRGHDEIEDRTLNMECDKLYSS